MSSIAFVLGNGESRRGIDIDDLEIEIDLAELKRPQTLLKPLAQAATLTAVEAELSHQSGTGSQPQGVKGWQRNNRLTVSKPPLQGPCR